MEEDQIVAPAVETTPANTVAPTTNTTSVRSQKVISRNFTNQGDILLTLENGLKVIVNKEQIGTILMIGESVPKIGSIILVEDSVNPTTGEISGTWAKLSL